MKTKFRQIAVATFFALFITFGNVYADGKEKSTNIVEKMGAIITEANETTLDFNANGEVSVLENVIEETLNLENWMINDEVWSTGDEFALETEIENSLEIENWMINDKVWKTENPLNLEDESDISLELEAWMTDKNVWNN